MIVCVIGTLLVSYPLLQPGFIVTDDGTWMIIRLSAFFQNLKDGQFPVRFISRLNFGYGYPVSNFLYPGYLYVGSALKVIGFSFVNAIKVMLIGSIFVTSIAVFGFLKKLYGAKSGFIGGLSILFSPYFMYDIYKRGSVGEVMAIASFAVALYAIESNIFFLIPLALASVIMSHNTVGLFMMGIIFIYMIIRKKMRALIGLPIAIGMTIFFWLPALMEQSFVMFKSITIASPNDYVGVSTQIILGYAPLIAMSLWMILREKEQRKNMKIVGWGLLGIALLMTPVATPIWNITAIGKVVQFPFRLLSVWIVGGACVLAAWASGKHTKGRMALMIVSCVWMASVSIPYITSVKHEYKESGYYTTNESTTTTKDEYMPIWVKEIPNSHADTPIEVIQGKMEILVEKNTTKQKQFTVIAKEEGLLYVNTLFYPGWGASMDGKPVEIGYANPKGVIEIAVPVGEHKIFIEFRETIIRFLANICSALSIVWYGLYLVVVYFGINIKKKIIETWTIQ